MSSSDDNSQHLFRRLKLICVPISEHSLLTPSSIPNVSRLLSELITALHEHQPISLTPSLLSYVFFPLSSLLRRNPPLNIPDQILEKILQALTVLCERWWWDCELKVWDQIIMLCAAIIGDIESQGGTTKGKWNARDEETKAAAVQCMYTLLRPHISDVAPEGILTSPSDRFKTLVLHAQEPKLIPIIGESLNSLLGTAVTSKHRELQKASLQILLGLVNDYAPDYLLPGVLPGIVSSMTKVALGINDPSGSSGMKPAPSGKGWANGDIVSASLAVMEAAISRTISDDICIREGALRNLINIEDLASLADDPESILIKPQKKRSSSESSKSYATTRSPSWLSGTSSQLHIAINTLTPLISHPTGSALIGLIEFSKKLIENTQQTLPQTQPLLISYLLSLSNSDLASVSKGARDAMSTLLEPNSDAKRALLRTMISITSHNLVALPRVIPSQAEAKIEHLTGQIEAVARLAHPADSLNTGVSTISGGIASLLGPTGGIEKWGWTLLNVLELKTPEVTISTSKASVAQLTLETDPSSSEHASFPEVMLKSVPSRQTYEALSRMLRSLGRAGGSSALFSVEWFAGAGRGGQSPRAVTALWCAGRLLEGIAGISLDLDWADTGELRKRDKRLEKFARGLAKDVAELWDNPNTLDDTVTMATDSSAHEPQEEDDRLPTELRTGALTVRLTLGVNNYHKQNRKARGPSLQPLLHKCVSLHLLALAAGILQAKFTPLLIHTLYPILHSLVSPVAFLSITGLACLNYITVSTSYASISNLLLSNFDYALDSVSRRLTRRWLDVDATRVLVVLVRLVGNDVVQKAGDVVEECFERLDEYHGYEVLVEGLIEVLGEVIKVVEMEEKAEHGPRQDTALASSTTDPDFDAFFTWFANRNVDAKPDDHDCEDYGPAPHRAWGEEKTKDETDANVGDLSPEQTNLEDNPTPTPAQALTKQIVSRSLYFLTHGSPIIRARILMLLSSSVPVLPESALLPSIHQAWPFVLNRLGDPEAFVVSASAGLVEALATYVGSFMYRRVWEDVWPRFRTMLDKLNAADSINALSRRDRGAVGTESAYTHSHRLYRSLMRTMTAAVKGVQAQDSSIWLVIVAFRRFLSKHAHEELQGCARQLYVAIGRNNADAVWLALSATSDLIGTITEFLLEPQWDIRSNCLLVMQDLARPPKA